uniref:KRAB domain-containing protein n=1 Tax=Sciurus vulgaris TaxID=55149 RepID=A0A8D2DL29_SCIVU
HLSFSYQVQESVTFKDVAINFTEEWGQMGLVQTLYHDVMLETYGHLLSVHNQIAKPKVIPLLEQEEEPCYVEQTCPESTFSEWVRGHESSAWIQTQSAFDEEQSLCEVEKIHME